MVSSKPSSRGASCPRHICLNTRPASTNHRGQFCTLLGVLRTRCQGSGTRVWGQPGKEFPPAYPARSLPSAASVEDGGFLMLSRLKPWPALGYLSTTAVYSIWATSTDLLTLRHRIITRNGDTSHTSKAERGRGKHSSYSLILLPLPVHRSAGLPPRLILNQDQASRTNRPPRPVHFTKPTRLQAQGRGRQAKARRRQNPRPRKGEDDEKKKKRTHPNQTEAPAELESERKQEKAVANASREVKLLVD